jgi:hypothetical protein
MRKGMMILGILTVVSFAVGALREGSRARGDVKAMETQSAKKAAEQNQSVKESPFVCNMLALDAEGRRRHSAVTKKMKAAVKEMKELPDGYAFRFPAEQSTILLTAEFIARERLCCPFFTFELAAEQEDGPLWLRLRGRDGVKDFIKAEFGIK